MINDLKKYTIKLLTEKDLNQVLVLDNICFGGLWSLDGYRREIESPNSCLLIMTIDNSSQEKVIGIACFWEILEEAHITILAIHPDFQSQGLGKYLLKHLLQEVEKKGLERATLEVSKKNIKALNLYQQFAFKVAGKRKKYYAKTGEDALILWKNILV